MGSVNIEQMESNTGHELALARLKRARSLTFRDGQGGAPLVSQDVQADAAVRVDVGVVDAGGEVDLGRLEGVVGREVDGEEEDTSGVR